MKEVNWSILLSIAIITSILSFGLLIPLWTIGLLTLFLVQVFRPTKAKVEPRTILPDNSFADDWEFKMYVVERD